LINLRGYFLIFGFLLKKFINHFRKKRKNRGMFYMSFRSYAIYLEIFRDDGSLSKEHPKILTLIFWGGGEVGSGVNKKLTNGFSDHENSYIDGFK